jgi:hypothetical protein
MKYCILKTDSAEALERNIVALLRQGWQPQGGVSCSLAVEHENISEIKNGPLHPIETVFHEVWAQAMVREGRS